MYMNTDVYKTSKVVSHYNIAECYWVASTSYGVSVVATMLSEV